MQVNFADCTDRSSLSFDGDHYQLLNVHIHSVSEHEVSCSCLVALILLSPACARRKMPFISVLLENEADKNSPRASLPDEVALANKPQYASSKTKRIKGNQLLRERALPRLAARVWSHPAKKGMQQIF